MNTHDKIELPPLRIPDLEDELTAVLCAAIRWGGSVISSEEYVAAKQRFRAAVNAAIEADRQARGELWGWVIRGTGYRKEWTFTGESAERLAKRDAFLLGDESRAVPLYVGAAPQIPEGFKLVPIEPIDEMIEAGCALYDASLRQRYKAMLEAAPQPTRSSNEVCSLHQQNQGRGES